MEGDGDRPIMCIMTHAKARLVDFVVDEHYGTYENAESARRCFLSDPRVLAVSVQHNGYQVTRGSAIVCIDPPNECQRTWKGRLGQNYTDKGVPVWFCFIRYASGLLTELDETCQENTRLKWEATLALRERDEALALANDYARMTDELEQYLSIQRMRERILELEAVIKSWTAWRHSILRLRFPDCVISMQKRIECQTHCIDGLRSTIKTKSQQNDDQSKIIAATPISLCWTHNMVADMLEAQGHLHWAWVFRTNGVNGRDLLDMTYDDVMSMGLDVTCLETTRRLRDTMVRPVAHAVWISAGKSGDSVEHWHEAERIISREVLPLKPS